jgi:hypothetical protein
MCIFFTSSGVVVGGGSAAQVVRVANTRIFARLTGPSSQLLVYDMSFGSQTDAAMVLPLPVSDAARADAVRFIDFSLRAGFFDGLERLAGFWTEEAYEQLSMDNLPGSAPPARPPLPVREVGAYEASYVPSPGDFDRLDKRFQIPAGLWDAHPQYADYGFAVFRLRQTEGALKGVHPMALEFDSRLGRRVFAPTVHVHDGAVHALAFFDHQIYLQGATIQKPDWIHYRDGVRVSDGDRVPPGAKAGASHLGGRVEFSRPASFLGPDQAEMYASPNGRIRRVADWMPYLDPLEHLHGVQMSGMLPNADTFFTVNPVETRPL